ncbi:MAG TPA: efflux RND transporter periplasmic adaptor subunit [Rhodopila sp.]|jgi:RND family efflux transporter MFP subunit|nr:efflux RND transporter periplasmic adaptor subunit [Rhodopila sp.]
MRRLRNRIGYAVIGLTLLASGCKKSNQYVPPPPPKVSVATPLSEKITHYLEATGNTAAVASVDLVARVQGFVQGISYTDGAKVKTGDILFTIEPLPYQAKLQQAQAAEAASQATLVDAQANFLRNESLQKNSVASVQNLDDARATRDNAQASVAQAHANTQLAAINYSYTRVLAPFAGRVSAHLVSIGDLVGTSPTKLATIVQMQPMYVTFNVSEQEVQRIRANALKSGRKLEAIQSIPVEIGLQGETGYPHRGHMDYVAPMVDPSTGTLAARGVLANTDDVLLPGYFARVRVPLETDVSALLVPDAALGADQGGRYVLVVNKNHVVEQKHVTTGPEQGTFRVIETGLTPDDSVIVDGLQRAVPGEKVDPATVRLMDVSQ